MVLCPSGLRGRSAKPFFIGSNPIGTSNALSEYGRVFLLLHKELSVVKLRILKLMGCSKKQNVDKTLTKR